MWVHDFMDKSAMIKLIIIMHHQLVSKLLSILTGNRVSTSKQQLPPLPILNFLFMQVLARMSSYDLGCGPGGGRDTRDTFKVRN